MEKWKFIQDEIEQSKTRLVRTRVDDYKYKYNGKEWQDELGLNFYDYGARNYDPALGRWMNMDKFSEAYYSISPFIYAANNPIKFIDVNGDYIWIWDEDKKNRYKYENGKLYAKNDETGEYDQDYSAEEGGYVAQMQEYLNQIGCEECENGRILLEFFNEEGKEVHFTMNEGGRNYHDKGGIKTDFSQDEKIFTTGPRESVFTNFFATIAHELGHAKSYYSFSEKRRKLIWYSFENAEGSIKDVLIDEVYALYIENLIRTENNLNLRTHYDSFGGGRFLRGKKGKLTKEAQSILSKYFRVDIDEFKK